MGKWTPGRWEVDYLDQNDQRVVRSPHIEICTCWHHCVGSIEKEMEANARLIAAAPELYDALEHTVQFLLAWRLEYADKPSNDPQKQRVEAAIKQTAAALSKARGDD